MSDIKQCLQHGAGPCRNEDMIEQLQAELLVAQSAPELLSALKETADALAHLLAGNPSDTEFDLLVAENNARAAIAKATAYEQGVRDTLEAAARI